MPVIRNVRLCLSLEQMLSRRQFRYTSKLQPQMVDVLKELLATVSGLLTPAFVYKSHPVTGVGNGSVCLGNDIEFHSSVLSRFLGKAQQVSAVVGTIGSHLEEKVAEYFAQKEKLKGLMLDLIGTVALDSLSMEICNSMEREASSQGYQAGSPLSPGVLDWPIVEQRQLFQLVPAGQIGAQLTPSGMMIPLKSVSMVVGMGEEMPIWTRAEVCNHCHQSKTCLYRVHA